MSKLTDEETAKVFAMYYGCQFQYTTAFGNSINKKVLFTSDADYIFVRNIDSCKLLLTPLSEITDEHAKELVRLRSPIYLNLEITDQHRGRKEWGFTFHFEYASSRRRRHDDIGWKSLTPLQFQFMVAKGYAVPLYFGIDHPCNGMDAITLGIALDKTTLKCTSKC